MYVHDDSHTVIIKALNYFCINHGDQMFFFRFEIIINVLVLVFSDLFKYLCYGSTKIIKNTSTVQ